MRWFSAIPNHVPYAKGPYVPGCCDIMTDYSKTGQFLRLYYPTDLENDIESYAKKWTPWLPDECYLLGFGKVLTLWIFVIKLLAWLVSGKLYIPAVYGAKVKSNTDLKCVIFSHGLGGIRFLYTSICIELASQGFLVLAMEHRDESACRTYYYKNKNDVEKDKKTFIEHASVKLGNDHYTIRNNQIQKRVDECRKIVEFVQNVNKGVIPYNILKDLPNGNVEFDFKQLIGQIDIDSLTMVGHSFGAATALVTLSKEKLFKQGVLLDTWMFPIKNMPELVSDIKQPLLFINTQTFHITSNVKIMKLFLEGDKQNRVMYTMKRTTHENQTDTVFVIGYWLNWFMRKLNPAKAIYINNAILMCFLNDHVGIPVDVKPFEEFLLKESDNFYTGLTKPWA